MAIKNLQALGALGGVVSYQTDTEAEALAITPRLEKGQLVAIGNQLRFKDNNNELKSALGYEEIVVAMGGHNFAAGAFQLSLSAYASNPIPLRSPEQIIGLDAILIQDGGYPALPYNYVEQQVTNVPLSIMNVDDSMNLNITPTTLSYLEDGAFTLTTANRGWITIKYVPFVTGMFEPEE